MARDVDLDLSKKPTAGAINRRWDDGEDDVCDAIESWWKNDAFLQGYQWVRWNRNAGQLALMSPDILRTRRTINRMRPALNALMGRLTAKPLRFEVQPSAADDSTTAGARLGENVLQSAHDDNEWEKLRADAIRDAYCGHVSMIYMDWDPAAGEFLEYDEGNEKVVGTGEIILSELPVTDFRLAPGIRDPYASPYWISGVAMPAEEAKRRWKLKEIPEGDALMGRSPLQISMLTRSGRADMSSVLVKTYWQPPMEGRAEGYVATVIGEQIVDGPHPWPFPFKRLNFALFTQDRTKLWTGSSVLNDCRGPQHDYNCIWSANIEAAMAAGTPYLAMDTMTADENEDITDEPGMKLVYPPGSNIPVWVQAPGPTRGLREMIGELDRILDDALANHAVSRGDVNVNRTPASSIAQLAEKDDTPLGRFAHDQAEGWARLGTMILETYEKKVTETRTVKVMQGRKVTATTGWNGRMLAGQTTARVPLEVTKPFSRVAARQGALELWDRKIIQDPIRIAELMDEDPDDWLETLDPDVARAKREHVQMMGLEVPMAADYDDHRKHIAEHNAFRKSAAYEQSDPHIWMIMEAHLAAHEKMEAQQMEMQAQKAMADPGSERLAQASAPPLSQIPPPFAQRQAMAAQASAVARPAMPAGPSGP